MGVVGSVGYQRKRRPVYRPADSLPIDEGDLRALALAYDAALEQDEGLKNTKQGNTNRNAAARLIGSGRLGGEKGSKGKLRSAHEGDRAREREATHHISSDAWNPLGTTEPPHPTRAAAAATKRNIDSTTTGEGDGVPSVGRGERGGVGERGRAVEDHSVSAMLMSSATARGSGHLVESPPQHLSSSMRAAHRSGRGDATNNSNNNTNTNTKRPHADRRDDHASYDHDAEWMYQLSHYEKLHTEREREKRETGRAHQKRDKA